jgi:hypothetical protein
MQNPTRAALGTHSLDPENVARGVEQFATGILTGLSRVFENLQTGMSQQNRITPTPRHYLRVRADAIKVFENAVKTLPLAFSGVTKEAGQLCYEAEYFAKKVTSDQVFERIPSQRDAAGAKGQDKDHCPSLLEARTSARCTMARLQIHAANLLMAAEIVMSCVEVVTDCGLDENPCLGTGWPSVYPGCGVLPDGTDVQVSATLGEREMAMARSPLSLNVPPRTPAHGAVDVSSTQGLQRVLKVMEAGWSEAVPDLKQAVALAAGTSARETVGKSRDAVWLAYQRRNPSGTPPAKQPRGLDQSIVYAAMDDIAAHVGTMTDDMAKAKVDAVYGKPDIYSKGLAEFMQASSTSMVWSSSQIEREAKECCEQIIFRHSRTVANDVSDEAVHVIKSLPKEFNPAGDIKTTRDIVAQICDDETLEEICTTTQAAVKAAIYDAVSAQAEVVPGVIWNRVSAALAANG